jgi:MFS family permease
MRTFFVVWSGQVVSLLGSGLTTFALGVWVYERTGSVTQFSLILLVTVVPSIVMAPFAGVLVDRWDRRWAMILSDAGAAAATLAIVVLLVVGSLEVWYLYPILTFASLSRSLQLPAYTAATTLLVPREHYGRAAGLVQMGQALSGTLSPVVAGFLMAVIYLRGVILIDLLTFMLAVLTLLVVRVPRPPATTPAAAKLSVFRQAGFGFSYILERRGLLALLGFFAVVNFSLAVIQALITPMILEFSTPQKLGTALSVGALGMLVGTVLLSAWGGPKTRIHGVLGFGILLGTGLMLTGLRASIPLITAALFLSFLSAPFINGASQAIWQTKTPADAQGRVFAVRQMIAWSSLPLGYLAAGGLADRVFRPLLIPGGPLADSVGRVLGVGASRGIGLLFMVMGAVCVLVSVAGYLYPRLRNLERELEDARLDGAEPTESAVQPT